MCDLDLSQNNRLWYLDCSENHFTPSRLSVFEENLTWKPIGHSGDRFYYVEQRDVIYLGKITVGETIDLSAEYGPFKGYITSYTWSYNGSSISYPALANGKFVARPSNVGKRLVCYLKNSKYFWAFISFEVDIVAGTPIVEDHMKLITSSVNRYSVRKGENFSVYVRFTDPENLKIGLI